MPLPSWSKLAEVIGMNKSARISLQAAKSQDSPGLVLHFCRRRREVERDFTVTPKACWSVLCGIASVFGSWLSVRITLHQRPTVYQVQTEMRQTKRSHFESHISDLAQNIWSATRCTTGLTRREPWKTASRTNQQTKSDVRQNALKSILQPAQR